MVLGACANPQPDAAHINELQAKSYHGRTEEWKLDPALPEASVQEMRTRAYRYCLSRKASDKNCFDEQDHSLFAYANSFRLIRAFRSEEKPTFPAAVGHQQDPTAFKTIHRYCRSVYEDAGSEDARSLGPCMYAGLQADFFGVTRVA